MGVIQMDGHLRRKSVKRGMRFEITPKDITEGAGDQEIFLDQTEFATSLDRIRRIQDFGNDLGGDLLLYGSQVIALVEDLHIEFIRRACREQPQVIHRPATIANNRNVSRDTDHHAPIDPARHPLAVIDTAIDWDDARLIRALNLPRGPVRTPEVRAFFLIAIVNFLPEQAVVVVNTIAIAWHPEGGERIEKTRRQATKPAIAQGWVTLALAQLFEINPHAQQGFLAHLKETQVLQVRPQQTTNEELHREIIEAFCVGFTVPRRGLEHSIDHAVPHCQRYRDKQIAFGETLPGFRQGVAYVVTDRLLECIDAILQRRIVNVCGGLH